MRVRAVRGGIGRSRNPVPPKISESLGNLCNGLRANSAHACDAQTNRSSERIASAIEIPSGTEEGGGRRKKCISNLDDS